MEFRHDGALPLSLCLQPCVTSVFDNIPATSLWRISKQLHCYHSQSARDNRGTRDSLFAVTADFIIQRDALKQYFVGPRRKLPEASFAGMNSEFRSQPINRTFLLFRLPSRDYEQIVESCWSVLFLVYFPHFENRVISLAYFYFFLEIGKVG
jgi:hypothetical protein